MDPDGDGDPSDGVDGWRLDVPEEVPMAFWVEWCALVRSINPEAYIVGEIWKAKPEWLDGRTFDADELSPLPRLHWNGSAIGSTRSASEAARTIRRTPGDLSSEVTYALQNLVDSHDTDRLVSKLHNPDRAYDSAQQRTRRPDVRRLETPGPCVSTSKTGSLLQMTRPVPP